MTNDAPERVLAALEEVARYPEYAHKVNWAVIDFIRRELMAYGRAWEQAAGPVSERGGSPMEAGEELVGAALAPLLDKITEILLSVQADKEAAVAAEREAIVQLIQNDYPLGLAEDITCDLLADEIRARGNTNALAERDARVKTEALRDLLDLKWTCFHNLETEVDVVSVHDILALIPDQHKVDG